MRRYIARYLYLPWVLPLLVFIGFLLANWCIYGPAYLSDEVGYLNKAATIAGQTVDISSSWFGGYSILISPAFFISHNPFVEWRIILLLNALMWALTAVLLRYILRQLRPRASEGQIFIATAGSMLYPAWITMSGYAFATSGFVLVFALSLALLIKSGLSRPGWLLLSAIAVGYTYWIHPLGAIYVALFTLLMCLLAVVKKRWFLLAMAIVAASVAILYNLIITPLFNSLMSSDFVNNYHYSSTIYKLATSFSIPGFVERFLLLIVGLAFALIISSLGLVVFVGYDSLKRWKRSTLHWREKLDSIEFIIPIFLITLLCAVLCFNAFMSAGNSTLRVDEWIYGRYTDMYLLPLLGLALLSVWHRKVVIFTAIYVMIAGLILWVGTSNANTYFYLTNKGNIQGFWPITAAHILPVSGYFVWGVLGSIGILLCLFVSGKRSKKYLLILLLPIIIADFGNIYYHRKILVTHSTVTSLYTYIKSHYSKDDCIGFPVAADSQERFALYSYYLHGYDVEQMTLEQWLANNCQGPYFTYDKELVATRPDLHISGIEAKTGLLMITKNSKQTSVTTFY